MFSGLLFQILIWLCLFIEMSWEPSRTEQKRRGGMRDMRHFLYAFCFNKKEWNKVVHFLIWGTFFMIFVLIRKSGTKWCIFFKSTCGKIWWILTWVRHQSINWLYLCLANFTWQQRKLNIQPLSAYFPLSKLSILFIMPLCC